MKLHLGVNDVSEFESDMPLIDVARILEDKYGLFSNFVSMNKDFIEKQLVESLNSQLLSLTMAQSSKGSLKRALQSKALQNPFQGALEQIENRFQEFLSLEELAGKVPGVPTKASREGKTRIVRYTKSGKRSTKQFKRRGPSFVDTGTLRTHLRVWTEQ